eukprot:1158882-Pelagomonas_calceolata.AAC.5
MACVLAMQLWAIGKEQLVKAHRADPVNSHVGPLNPLSMALCSWSKQMQLAEFLGKQSLQAC